MPDERPEPPSEPFVELPAPTAWPMVMAFGITLGFAGLVTNGMVSAVGVVLMITGAVGWFRDVLPVEDVERIPLRPPALRAKPVQPAPQAVMHLVAGQGGHRVRLPAEIHRGGLLLSRIHRTPRKAFNGWPAMRTSAASA